MIDPKTRFSDRAPFYLRSRPKYPPALLEFCKSKLSLRPDHRIADIGSGTGFLTELFLPNGNPVFAVEPNAAMRHAAESSLARFANFHSIAAAAEATSLDPTSIDFILAGQAFHWFDGARSRQEFLRILRPSSWLILVWNHRRPEPGTFTLQYGQIVKEFQNDKNHPAAHHQSTVAKSDEMARFFHPGPFAVKTFPNSQTLDLGGVIDRALSSSNLPLPGQPRSDEMLQKLRDAFAAHAVGGKVRLDYDTSAFYGHLV
jgi:SAM-dependent methyltransferase